METITYYTVEYWNDPMCKAKMDFANYDDAIDFVSSYIKNFDNVKLVEVIEKEHVIFKR